MEKQCKKCGKKLDNDFSDYCLDCLKFSYSKLVKEKQEQKEDSVLNSCNKEEATLIVIANIVLTIGIIASIGLSLKPWGIALKFLFLHHENILFPND